MSGELIPHRFSEDIDIHITPPEELELKTGKNHNKPIHIEARKAYYDFLAKEISIVDIEASRDTAFDDVGRYRNSGIRLAYHSDFEIDDTAAKEAVLLEAEFDDIAPNAPINISSWVYERAWEHGGNITDNRAKDVLYYEPVYTFVEKLQTVCRQGFWHQRRPKLREC